jgi:hypothetical protein
MRRGNGLQGPTVMLLAVFVAACGGGGGGGTTSSTTTTTSTAPGFSYGSPNYQFTVGIAANTLTPNNAGSIKSWSISPALPAGLTFDTTTGAISGLPTADSPTTTYVISGDSSGQQTKSDLAIGVTSNIILNLGDVASPQYIQFDTAHVLTQDVSGHWYLWNYATTAQIANGVSLTPQITYIGAATELAPAAIALAGPTAVIQTASGLEVRSSSTGEVQAEITVNLPLFYVQPPDERVNVGSWWKLASDGSYVCAGNNTSLTCWSPSGQQLFTQSGNYANADVLLNYANTNVIASPTAFLIPLVVAGNGVIETVSTATWTSSMGPSFQGAFSSWFVDGSRFLTTIPAGTQIGTTVAAFNTLFVYSLASVLEDTETMPTLQGLTGQGNWFWTNAQPPLSLYAVGNNTAACMPIPCTMPTPAATYPLQSSPLPIGTFITSISGNALTVIDLSGATPVETSFVLPVGDPGAFTAISPSQFIESSRNGVIIALSPPSAARYFDYGALTSFAGSNTRVVFTTGSGETFSYNLTTNAFETTVQLPPDVRQVVLSSDGSVLADLYGVGGNVNVYSMPSGTLINSFPAQPGPVIGLSGNGAVLAECCTATVPVTGGAAMGYVGDGSLAQLSPDGTLVAASDSISPANYGFGVTPPTTRIYKNGALVAVLPGYTWVLGWPTNSTVIVSTFALSGPLYTDGRISDFTFSGNKIYSATGAAVGAASLGPIYTYQFALGDLAYANFSNVILSITTGATLWASADPPVALAVGNPVGSVPASYFTGSTVVFSSGNLVLSQPY